MAVVEVRGRGQVTILLSLGKELHLNEGAILTVVKAGNVLLMTPRSLQVDTFARRGQSGDEETRSPCR